MSEKYCIGIDYGTDSVRALLVNSANGQELATSIFEYPRWKKRLYCNQTMNQFRHHPLDYLEGLEFVLMGVINSVPNSVEKVCSISIDTTGSTVVAVDETGTPLSLLPQFSEDPDAMFILWKDHTAINEADQINSLCRTWPVDYLKYSGGKYSCEWFWAKILHVFSTNKNVARSAFSWVELCDWIPFILTGGSRLDQLKRSRCAAGHKAMWNAEWDGLPSENFLNKLHPKLGDLKKRLYVETYTSDNSVGHISDEWAKKTGLQKSVVIGVGTLDAHAGAVGGQIKQSYMIKVVGTSTCDMLVAPLEEMKNKIIRGICGQVDGSIIPGMIGMEAGQSAFGDIYAWFRDLLLWPTHDLENKSHLLEELNRAAALIPVGGSDVLSLDWLNGRRSPDENPYLKGVISGLTLGTRPPEIFKALVEGTAFGSKKIVERFNEEKIPIKGVMAVGGVAKKSPLVMQTLADVLDVPIKVVRTENASALGAAMFASVVAGIHGSVQEAQEKMGSGFELIYEPISQNASVYKVMYQKYLCIADFFENFYSPL